MKRNLTRLEQDFFDVLVIGGGINGAAVAHLSQKNGWNTALIEKNDFAGGTSSRSTKLIHGGLRYLEHLEVGLVRESLKERFVQLKAAPHLVKPLPFIIPVYAGDSRPLWMMRLGVFLYDFISGKFRIGRHRKLSREEIFKLIPDIRKDGLKGGVLYYDAQMDDARLCLENVLSAAEAGACAANYTEARSFIEEGGRVTGVTARDTIRDRTMTIRAEKIICTAGPWTNGLLRLDPSGMKKMVRTTKGIHVVYRKKLSDSAMLVPVEKDGRIFFVIPWREYSLIGTTDTNYAGKPERVCVEESDIDYLFEGARRVFPDVDFQRGEIVSRFAGLRPLVRIKGRPSDVSRKHVIVKSSGGVVYVIGGKYTTYRKIAEDSLKQAGLLKRRTPFSVYGGGVAEEPAREVSAAYEIDEESAQAVMNQYGARYRDVLELTRRSPDLRQRICPRHPEIKAQIVYAVETEMAKTADDIIERRLAINCRPCCVEACRQAASAYL